MTNIDLSWVPNQESWVDKYIDDPASPSALIPHLQNRDCIGIDELSKIAMIKSRRRARLVSQNSDCCVREITRLAFDVSKISDEQVRIGLLTSLHGVRVPMASAVLSWVWPSRWAVIDRRAWSALAYFGLVDGKKRNRLSALDWVTYCQIVDQATAENGWTPQKLDRWLYGFAREKGLGE